MLKIADMAAMFNYRVNLTAQVEASQNSIVISYCCQWMLLPSKPNAFGDFQLTVY